MSRRGLFRDTSSGVVDDGLTPVALATTGDLAGYQPLDSDLTAIAALTTTSFGRALLALADAAALRTDAGLVVGTDVEAHDPDLTTIAGLTPTNDDIIQRKAGAWTNRTIAQLIADLGALGTTFQPLDSDLTAIAALSTTTFGRSLLTSADAAAARTALGLGTAATHATGDYDAAGAAAAAQAASQPLDADLTAIGGLDSTVAGVVATDGAGWFRKTYAGLKTSLGLVKADVGLGSVDNTADAAKSVASAAILTTARTINGVSFDGSANITTGKTYLKKPSGNITTSSTTLASFSTAWQIASVVVAAGQNVKLQVMCTPLSGSTDHLIGLYRGSTLLASWIGNSGSFDHPRSFMWVDENPGAGTYTYEVKGASFTGALTVFQSNPTTDANGGASIFIAEVYTP